MTDTIYYTILAILVALFSPFVWYVLKEKSFKTKSSDLEKENSELKKTIFQKEKKSLVIKDAYDKQQIELAEKDRKLGMLAKYTFDPRMGFFMIGDKAYCPICLLQFNEPPPLGVKGNQFQCPACNYDYAKERPYFIDINQYFDPNK